MKTKTLRVSHLAEHLKQQNMHYWLSPRSDITTPKPTDLQLGMQETPP